ncbi:MAG: hypothetical protein ABSE73_22040 [Planctomycetota bacterium]
MTPDEIQKAAHLYCYQAAVRGFLRANVTEEDFEIELEESLDKVQIPFGEDPALTAAWERAKIAETPATATLLSPEYRQLIRLMRELQRDTGEAPFHLSVEQLRTISGLSNKVQANRRLHWLKGHGFIEEITKGTLSSRLASEYRYILDSGPEQGGHRGHA